MDDALSPAPYHQLIGIRLLEWRDGFARVGLTAGHQHMNRSLIVHGGVILSMIDQAGAFAGLYCPVPGNVRRAVTVDLDCRFTGQAGEGELVAEGRLVTAGSSMFFTRTEVFNAAGGMVAFGAGTHRWRRGSNVPEGVPADAPVGRG